MPEFNFSGRVGCVVGYCIDCTFLARLADVCILDFDRGMDFDIAVCYNSAGVGIKKMTYLLRKEKT